MKPIRVLIVDDNFVARRGLRSVLEAEEGIDIAGEACNGQEAVRKVPACQADVVLMDIRMPEMDGIEATLKLAEGGTEKKILILTVVDDPLMLANALNAGAAGYLVYGHFSPAGLIAAVKSAAGGQKVTMPPLASFFPDTPRVEAGETRIVWEALTPREAEVLKLIAAGQENREIADALAIEEKTVKNHINNIYSKLGVNSRKEAIARVLSDGLNSP